MSNTGSRPRSVLHPRQTERYYRAGHGPADAAIRAFLRDSLQGDSPLIVHGAQAINAWLPSWLDKETRDWDIFAPDNAESLAWELERKLDKRYGGDFFEVEPGKHVGTYRVRSKVTGEPVADITLKEREVRFRRAAGINYATLEDQEAIAREILADETQAFRHKKDRDTIQRIAVYRESRKRSAGRRRMPDYLVLPPGMGGMRV